MDFVQTSESVRAPPVHVHEGRLLRSNVPRGDNPG